MKKEDEKNIKCRYKLPNDNKEYSGEIAYRNGTFINFSTNNPKFHIDEQGHLLCVSDENEILLLWRNKYFEDRIIRCAGFDCLIKGLNDEIPPDMLKFKKICFSFPYINDFFIGIDKIEFYDQKNPQDAFLKYVRSRDNISYSLNNNFKMKILHGVTWTAGSFGGSNAKMSLEKEIEISSNKYLPLDDFLTIIRNLISFFSLGLKRKLLITKMYSCSKNNSSKCKLEIIPFQYKILNQEFDKDIRHNHLLYVYPHIKKDFCKIIQEFVNLRSKDYRKFSVIVDLYLRNHDTPDEIYPQIKFLVYAQALEAYLNSKEYNQKKEISSDYIKIVKQLKQQHPDIKEIQDLSCNGLYSFKEKLLNSIKANNISRILELRYSKKNKITLLDDLVNLRNYFTHYNIPSEDKKIDSISIYELTENIKALLELFILKDLKFDDNNIKHILYINYPGFNDFNSKYIWIKYSPNLKNINAYNYIGTDISYLNKEGKLIFSIYYFYEELDDTVKLIIKYSEDGKYARKNSHRLKTQTKTIQVGKNLNSEQIEKLEKLFQICYMRYKKQLEQNKFSGKINNFPVNSLLRD